MDLEGYITYNLRNAIVGEWPFPHFFAQDVFPDAFYRDLQNRVHAKKNYVEGDRHYNGRKFAENLDDFPELAFMESGNFTRNIAKIFSPYMAERFEGKGRIQLRTDLRLVRDGQEYYIGPHTDAPWKVVSLLFYLPLDGWNLDMGTSLYLPKNPSFACRGGPHYEFEDFRLIKTVPFAPNTCFGFFRTDQSFHGVEKITREIQRDVLLFNIYDATVSSELPKPADEQQP